ncbi:MAG: hypothetical protein IJF14_02445 [Clostridia bacterium]|nr:hypothetical protein [Clostridia bacterium]
MKKLLAFLLALIMILSTLAACGEGDKKTEDPSKAESPEDTERTFESKAVEALVVTAEAFLARKAYVQYDDQSMVASLKNLTSIRRAERAKNSPETATGQFNVYSNCTEFVYDVYYYALGIDIVTWTTKLLENYTNRHAFSYYITGEETEEEQAKVFEDFKSAMKAGDILVCRHKGDTGGNTLLYIGDGKIIYSARSEKGKSPNYNYSTNVENIEPRGTVSTKDVDKLALSSDDSYFWDEGWWGISRPLIEYPDAQPTEEALNRINNLQGIVVEKLSSAPSANTALPGDEITFTFQIKNTTDVDTTLEIIDNVPQDMTYVSGAETVDGTTLKWNANIPAGKVTKIEYVLKINDGVAEGSFITSDSYVGGVSANSRPLFIGKRLTAEQRTALAAEMDKISKPDVFGTDLAEKIYASAGITIELESADAIIGGLFKAYKDSTTHFELNLESPYLKAIAPTMYGGYQVVNTTSLWNKLRTKGPQVNQLMVGDIVIMTENNKTLTYMVYDINRMMNLNTGDVEVMTLQDSKTAILSTLGNDKFVVIRPAMAIQ